MVAFWGGLPRPRGRRTFPARRQQSPGALPAVLSGPVSLRRPFPPPSPGPDYRRAPDSRRRLLMTAALLFAPLVGARTLSPGGASLPIGRRQLMARPKDPR
ncbi:hypothetical protein MRX96_030768 [Rhipicephalus microplus]